VIRRVRTGAGSLARLAELLLFPSHCLVCSACLDIPGERVVCRSCLERLAPRRGPICLSCGRFFDGAGESHLCGRCLERPPAYSVHRSCASYGGVLKDLILLFKYRRVTALAATLARFVEESLGGDETLWHAAEGLVPVPLHPKRKRERGFNQSRLLARRLSRLKTVPVIEGALVRTRNVPPQTSLRADDREANVRGAFAVRREARVRGRVLVLVDDVFTTGSTLGECSRALKAAGAEEVRALTIAQA
jgi:competence protein ComFC